MASHFLHPYYVFNFLWCTGAYLLARTWLGDVADSPYTRLGGREDFTQWEFNLLALACTGVMYKLFRYRSAAGFTKDMLNYVRLVSVVALFMVDYRLLVLHILAIYGSFLTLPEPWYTGPDKLINFTALNFKETVLDDETDKFWLIVCYTNWSQDCKHLSQDIAELSLEYTTPKLAFGRVDLGQWASLVLELKVDTSPNSTQLPTLLLFQKGELLHRMPQRQNPNPFATGTAFSKADVERVFELAKRSKGTS